MAANPQVLRGTLRACDFLARAGLIAAAWLLGAHAAEAGEPLNLLITIDTETSSGCGPTGCFPVSMEDRILGLKDGSEYGIALIMSLLEEQDMRGTFFVNAFLDSYYPEADVQRFVQRIVARGHDVQFHSHEEFRCFRVCPLEDLECRRQCLTTDSFLVGNTREKQLQILTEGANNIARWSGAWPVAFRGGSYRTGSRTLMALHDLNIRIDSSVDGGSHRLNDVFPVNTVSEHEGIIEIPILEFRAFSIGPYSQYRQLDLESNTFAEVREVLEQSQRLGVRTVMSILHSFSFCRLEADLCPHEDSIRRVRDLLAYVAAQEDIRVLTLKEFAASYPANPTAFIGTGAVPTTGYWLTLLRSIERSDEGWKNLLFVLANALAVLAVAASCGFLVRRYRRARQPAAGREG